MMKEGNRGSQLLVQVQPPLNFPFPEDFPKGYPAINGEVHSYNDVSMVNDNANHVEMSVSRSEEASDESTLPENAIDGEDTGQQLVVEEQKETSHATGVVRTSEDGYNWRKYGQKQVKGSEYPRSYYKCTQPNCQVKKKVERSHDGQITEIIYKGAHNHPKPHSSRRTSALSNDEISEIAEAGETCVKVDCDSVWGNIHSGMRDTKHRLAWKADGQERTSSASAMTELADPISTKRAKPESEDTPEFSSTHASHGGDADGATQAVMSLEDDAESESKRRFYTLSVCFLMLTLAITNRKTAYMFLN